MYKFVPKNNHKSNENKTSSYHTETILNIQAEPKAESNVESKAEPKAESNVESKAEPKAIINDDDFPVLGMSNNKKQIKKEVKSVWTKLNESENKNEILDKLKESFPDEVAIVPKSKNIQIYRRREKKKDIYDSNSDDYEDDAFYESCPYITDIDRKYLDSDSEEFV